MGGGHIMFHLDAQEVWQAINNAPQEFWLGFTVGLFARLSLRAIVRTRNANRNRKSNKRRPNDKA